MVVAPDEADFQPGGIGGDAAAGNDYYQHKDTGGYHEYHDAVEAEEAECFAVEVVFS